MIALLLAIGVLMPGTPDSRVECYFDIDAQEFVCVAVEVTTVVATGGPSLAVDIDGPGPLPLQWSRTRMTGLPVDPPPCVREVRIEGADGAEIVVEVGVEWVITITDTGTGEVVGIWAACEWPGEDPPPPPTPPPPPPDMARDSEELAAIASKLSPRADGFGGVSQLETWFWCPDPGVVAVDAATPGARSYGEVSVVGLTWTIEGPDGTIERDADDCGSEPDPYGDGDGAAARSTPNLPGDYTISLEATWAGTWSTDPLVPGVGWITAGPFDFDPEFVVQNPVDYSVVEIQTVGRG